MKNKIKNKYNNMPPIAKASLWFVICGFLQRGISIISTPIFTRLLSTEEYGVFSVFNSWLEIITIFATLKLGYGVFTQGLVKFSNDKERFASSLLGLATTWLFVTFIIYILFHNFWNDYFGLSTTMMCCMFVMMIATVSFNFWAAEQRNEFKYISLVKLTLITSLLKPLCGIIAVIMFNNNKIEARIISLSVIELLCYFGLYIKLMKSGKTFFNYKYWKYALAFNLPLVPHYLSQVVLNHSDRIMIKELIGIDKAGIYSLAYSIAMVLTILNTAVLNSIRPWVFKKLKSKNENDIQKVGFTSLIIVACCNLLLIVLSPEVVHIFSPSSYGNAISLIPPITMGVYFAFMYNLFVDIQMYYGKTNSIMIVAIICATMNIVLNYIFIKKYGYIAAAYTTLFSYILMAILHYVNMRIKLKNNNVKKNVYPLNKLMLITIVFIGLAVLMVILSNYTIIKFFVLSLLLLILFIYKKKVTSLIKLAIS